MCRKRFAFSLLELLIVTAIIGVLLGMLLPAIQKARESASRAKCENHLRQLGIALGTYHDSYDAFPTDAGKLFTLLMPNIEQKEVASVSAGPSTADPIDYPADDPPPPELIPDVPLGVEILLCPARRDARVGPRTDYACARDSSLAGKNSIFGGKPCSLDLVTGQDGTSLTLMLSHKAIRSSVYNGGDPNDTGWSTNNVYDHARNADSVPIPDKDAMTPDSRFGSAHTGGLPSLFADGSVRTILFSVSVADWQALWTWNGGEQLQGGVE